VQSFVTVTDFQVYWGATVNPSDPAIAMALDSACEIVRSYLGQTINRATTTEYHDGTGRMRFRLQERPVRSITSIVIDNVTLDPSKYRFGSNGIVTVNTGPYLFWDWSSPLNWGLWNVSVTYDHGWDLSIVTSDDQLVPSDIRLVALSISSRVYNDLINVGVGTGPTVREMIGDYEYWVDSTATTALAAAGSTAMTEAEKSALAPYLIRRTV
jgi:hypothetical protein